MIVIIKPKGLEKMPHHWTIVNSDGAYILSPCHLIEDARDKQSEIIESMVAAYNEKLLENK